jgi:hypothetical protein
MHIKTTDKNLTLKIDRPEGDLRKLIMQISIDQQNKLFAAERKRVEAQLAENGPDTTEQGGLKLPNTMQVLERIHELRMNGMKHVVTPVLEQMTEDELVLTWFYLHGIEDAVIGLGTALSNVFDEHDPQRVYHMLTAELNDISMEHAYRCLVAQRMVGEDEQVSFKINKDEE